MSNAATIKDNHLKATALYETACEAAFAEIAAIEAEHMPKATSEADLDAIDELTEEVYSRYELDALSALKLQAEDALIDALAAHSVACPEFMPMAAEAGLDVVDTIAKARRILSTRAKLLKMAHGRL